MAFVKFFTRGGLLRRKAQRQDVKAHLPPSFLAERGKIRHARPLYAEARGIKGFESRQTTHQIRIEKVCWFGLFGLHGFGGRTVAASSFAVTLSAVLIINRLGGFQAGQNLGMGNDLVGSDEPVLNLLNQLWDYIFAGLLSDMKRDRAQIFFDAGAVSPLTLFEPFEKLQAARGELGHFLVLVLVDDLASLDGVAIVAADVVD